MSGRLIFRIGLFIVVVGLVFWMRMSRRNDPSKLTFEQVAAVVRGMHNYPPNQTLVDNCTKIAHNAAFDAAYTAGGRRTPDKYNEEKYIRTFFQSMREQVHMHNKPDLENELTDVENEVMDAHPDKR